MEYPYASPRGNPPPPLPRKRAVMLSPRSHRPLRTTNMPHSPPQPENPSPRLSPSPPPVPRHHPPSPTPHPDTPVAIDAFPRNSPPPPQASSAAQTILAAMPHFAPVPQSLPEWPQRIPAGFLPRSRTARSAQIPPVPRFPASPRLCAATAPGSLITAGEDPRR